MSGPVKTRSGGCVSMCVCVLCVLCVRIVSEYANKASVCVTSVCVRLSTCLHVVRVLIQHVCVCVCVCVCKKCKFVRVYVCVSVRTCVCTHMRLQNAGIVCVPLVWLSHPPAPPTNALALCALALLPQTFIIQRMTNCHPPPSPSSCPCSATKISHGT